MTYRFEDMHWLVEASEDFRARCKILDGQKDDLGAALQRLAAARLNANQLTSLSSVIKRAGIRNASLKPLSSFHLSVLGNATTSLFVNALPAAAARHGVHLTTYEAEYDQVMQEALDPASAVNASKPDAIFLALDYHGLPFDGANNADAAIAYVETVRDGFARGCNAPVIFQTLVVPPMPVFGSYDVVVESSLHSKIAAFNAALVVMAKTRGDYIFDVAALAQTIGTQMWLDPVQWNLYKLPFAQSMVPLYVDHIARLLAAIRGLSKKCLVLDLDNTLWGGVIGDDGMHGIKIGQGDGAGEAYVEIQKMALALRDRGIILAVSSKNEDATARQPFREHPDMILREDHITVFQANWRDKASNLEAIAKTLNIGLDALVLLDDNPAERAQVREALPMVGVPELPHDVSYYPRALLGAGYFEAIAFSEDDKKRAEQYRQNAQRAELASSARNMEEFLASLDMKLEMGPFTPFNQPRVAQLINKTNQFNLTTRRYTEAEVEALAKDNTVITLQGRLIDKFGDNGLITVGIGCINGEVCEIDTWLMSCRVLGRKVEEAMLSDFAEHARNKGAKELLGRYIPSPKNAMVAEHYKKLGFTFVKQQGDQTLWSLKLSDFQYAKLPFERV